LVPDRLACGLPLMRGGGNNPNGHVSSETFQAVNSPSVPASGIKLVSTSLQSDPGETLDFCPIVADEKWLRRANLDDAIDAEFAEFCEQLLNR
jgi:hypothetical protein